MKILNFLKKIISQTCVKATKVLWPFVAVVGGAALKHHFRELHCKIL
jgi:hypothetical protein